MANYGIWIFIAYLFGSISSAILICKLFNLPDPRLEGSKNPGATNVARIAGKKIAALVLLCDGLKGFIPTFMVHYLFAEPLLTTLTALAAFLGHVFPIFFKFKGGKGVATAWGGFWGIDWMFGGFFTFAWLLSWVIGRISAIAALIAMTFTSGWVFLSEGFWVSLPVIIMYVIVLWRHKDNIQRIREGSENRV